MAQEDRESWVLLVECVAEGAPPVGFDQVRDLLGRLPHGQPSALYAPDRIGIQFSVTAPDFDSAVRDGLASWAQAVEDAGLEGWGLARVEVKTPAEVTAERAGLRQRESSIGASPSDAAVLREAYLATRALLQSQSVQAVAGVVSGVIYRLGGRVVPGSEEHADALPLDVSFGLTEPLYPAARGDPIVARRIREVVVPLIEDARILLEARGFSPPPPASA